MTNRFILFEGVDASGKTTLAKKLAESIGGIYYYNPPEVLRPLRDYADTSSAQIRYQYYRLGNCIASEEIQTLLKGSHVVCDWYAYSTIAYHSVLLDRELDMPDVLLPDEIIFVSADWEEIKRRLAEREVVSKYEDIEFLKQVFERYKWLFSDLSNVLEVDTSNSNESEMLDDLIGKLGV